MSKLDYDIEAEAKKIDAKIEKLKAEKANLKQRLEQEKQHIELARRVGLLILNEFKGKSFTYSDFETIIEENLISDYDRDFFGIKPLAENDPRRPKRRGRKKASPTDTTEENWF